MATEAQKIQYAEVSAPSTPAANKVVTYAKADGLMYSKDDGGTETLMSGGTAATRASLGLDTTDSPQFAGVNVGHASDTTLTRASAGVLNVEGNRIFAVGGTDVPVADGGTGASTASAAATNLGLGTGDSPQFTAVNIGAATDTTVGRTSAGVINVEGKDVYMAGGTDVAVADGGTGASTASAARTNLGLAYTQIGGYEFDYTAITSSVNITATSEATANTVLTMSSIAWAGGIVYWLEFFTPYTDVTQQNCIYIIHDGTSSIGYLGQVYSASASQIVVPTFLKYRITPGAGTRAYSIRAYTNTGTAVVKAGAGGAATWPPAWARMVVA